jgi:hypothetical protein
MNPGYAGMAAVKGFVEFEDGDAVKTHIPAQGNPPGAGRVGYRMVSHDGVYPRGPGQFDLAFREGHAYGNLPDFLLGISAYQAWGFQDGFPGEVRGLDHHKRISLGKGVLGLGDHPPSRDLVQGIPNISDRIGFLLHFILSTIMEIGTGRINGPFRVS